MYDRSINKTADGRHHGIDCWGIGNKNVFSASRGKVIFAGWDNTGYGNLVKVQDGEYTHYYAHLERILVKLGQSVDFTTQIGIYGATGNVTGPHLHYEVRKNGVVIDPTTLMGVPNKEGIYNSYNYVLEVDVWNYKYKICSGDTLNQLAEETGTNADEIARVNNIRDKNKIYVGQEILLPKAPAVRTYTVQKGDTLNKIAERFGTNSDYLSQKNNIKNKNLIYPGQVIKI